MIANLKIGRGNFTNDIGFHIPINILHKHSSKNHDLNNFISSQDVTTCDSNPQYLIIKLNKYNFINDVLQNNVVNKIPQHHLKNSKPRIIEFR